MANAISDHISKILLRADYASLDPNERAIVDRIVELAPQPAPDPGRPSWLDDLADRIALAIRSWWFVTGIVLLMSLWFLLNSPVMARFGLALDPYPFTFLKLMLSILAVVQGPIILISQHHADDSRRAARIHDATTAMHAKLEVLRLHERFDDFEAALSNGRLTISSTPQIAPAAVGALGALRLRAANSDIIDPASHAWRRLAAHRRGNAYVRPRQAGHDPSTGIH